MKNIKAWIDHLFWKRTWFRLFFVLMGILAVGIGILFGWLFGWDYIKNVIILIYIIVFGLGVIDNNNIDGVDYPLHPKRRTKK